MKKFAWKNKKVLVTGAAGFIGGNLVKELLSREATVYALVRLNESAPEGFFSASEKKKICFIVGDIRDFEGVNRIFSEKKIDTCFHLAAQPIVMAAFESPLPTFDVNIRGTINILEAARCSRWLKRLVVASTTHVYGNNHQLPYIESFSPQPTRPYETSKACADMLATTYHYTYGLPVAMTRMTNTYGPGDMNFSRLIPKVMQAVVDGKNPEIIGGTAVRDYLYVKDAVTAYLLLAENLARPEIRGQAFNFGSGQIFSVKEVAEAIVALSPKRRTLRVHPEVQLKKEIDTQYVSTEKAKALLGWMPKYTLKRGLKETYSWYQKIS
jgi:CDP-glucose 4,6-dehydratase